MIYKVTDQGRDYGKVFKLTEMPCAIAEELSLRALFLIQGAGLELPKEVQSAGIYAIAAMGFKLFCQHCKFDDVKPILDEMWKCIQIIPNPNNHNAVRPLNPDDSDIEEVGTRMKLRMQVLQLHLGFQQGGESSKSTISTEVTPPQVPTSKIMPTSRARSAQSSALAARHSESSKPFTA